MLDAEAWLQSLGYVSLDALNDHQRLAYLQACRHMQSGHTIPMVTAGHCELHNLWAPACEQLTN